MKFKSFVWVVSISFVLSYLLSSCASMGPKTIPKDGFNYNQHIASQQNEQILLNIVRLRYAEVPLFLNVSSVINQYSRDTRASIGGGNFFGTPNSNASINGGWSDRPTITYTPMGGRDFSESLLHPIPPASVFFLIQSGWAPSRMLRMTTSTINGLNNEIRLAGRRLPANPKFKTLLKVIAQLQEQGVFGMETGGYDTEQTVNIHFPEQITNDSIRSSILQFKQILNLNPELNSFPIRYGLIQKNRDEIFIRTRSLLEMFWGLSACIKVPQDHVSEGRTFPNYNLDSKPLLKIVSSKDFPDMGFAPINTRDYWFYIDDRDIESKTTFAVLQILMSLANDGKQSMGPIISIGQ